MNYKQPSATKKNDVSSTRKTALQTDSTIAVTSAADRMRRSRERRKDGYRVLRIPINIDVIEVLIELRYLSATEIHDYPTVSNALTRFIEHMASEVTSNTITLDHW